MSYENENNQNENNQSNDFLRGADSFELVQPGYGQASYSQNEYRQSTADREPSHTSTASERPPKQKKKHTWPKRVAGVVVCALLFGSISGVTFYGVNRLMGGDSPDSVEKTTESQEETQAVQLHTTSDMAASGNASSDNSSNGSVLTLNVTDIARQTMPAMVSITNVSVQEVQNYFAYYFGMGGSTTQEVESAGSGIIIGENDAELLIATNNHVVADAETLSVCFADNEAYEAHIKGTDSDNDLAVIAVNKSDVSADTMSQIAVAEIGDADALEVGEQVVAIGNALGYGQSVTTGIVSALNRQIDTTDAALIQTDAAINPGNSGGALLNMQGQVIGINSAKFSSTDVEGMGYAISMSAASPIIEELMNRETREKVAEDQASYLGIYGEDVSEAVESAYGIPQGIYVSELVKNGPAEQAGLTVKSVITKFDGISVSSMSDLREQLTYYAAGETVELTVQVPQGSEYVEQTISVTLGAAADAQTTQNQQSQGSWQGNGGMQGFGR